MEELEIEVVDENINLNTTSKKKTHPYMTKFEYSKIVSFRVIQLMHGEPPKIKLDGFMDYRDIAIRELYQRVIPLRIKRILPGGSTEIWNVTELNICNW
jgi:DNA-directed RNA polymerases I, II, and III subunit RPABC2